MIDVVRAVRERTVALDLAREQQQQQQQQQQQHQPQQQQCCNTNSTTTLASPSDGPSAMASALPTPPAEALAKSAGRGLAVALSLGELPSEVYQARVCVCVCMLVMLMMVVVVRGGAWRPSPYNKLTIRPLCPVNSNTTHHTKQAFYDAGAHRYLLRIETSNPELYSKLHPASHSWANRHRCLVELQRIGFQVCVCVCM